jgi:uncharacterized protein (TIGR02118 family)
MTRRLLLLLRKADAVSTADFASRVVAAGRQLAAGAVSVPDDALGAVKSPFPRGASFDALVDLADRAALPSLEGLVGAYRVEERRLKTAASAELCLVSPVRRAPALDRAAFDAHWRDRHGPLALRHHAGMSDYRQALVVECLGDAPPFDGIARLGFPSVEAFETFLFDSREGRRAIAEDTARFVDAAETEVRLLREVVLAE